MENMVQLHTHSEYSSLDGMATIDRLVKQAKEYGQPALAITDHGVSNSWVKFWKACRKAEIKPILGVEFYIVDDMDRKGLTDEEKAKYCKDLTGKALRTRMAQIQKDLGLRKRFHCIALAKNYDGYRNILRLINESNKRGFYYKPRIDYDLLYELKEGIIVTSGCMAGKIPQMILASEGASFYSDISYDVDAEEDASTDQIDAAWARMKEEFGDDFYAEIQSIEMEEQSLVNAGVVAYAAEFHVPVIATNDIHYVGQSDCVAHDVLLAIQTSFGYNVKRIDDPSRWRFDTQELWLKNRQQMVEDLQDFNRKIDLPTETITTACDNTMVVADKIQFQPWDQFTDPKVTPSVYLPRKYYPHPYTSAQRKTKKYWKACSDILWDWCLDGWKRKIKGKVSKEHIPEYEARLKYEFDMVKELNFIEYFIIIADLIKWSKAQGIVVGPARGSSSSSLVCYLTDITEIDPIPWRLMFERFISPNRTDNPDVDIDFAPDRRDEIKTYLAKKYGDERVALVGSNILFKGKLVLQDVARVHGLTPKDIEEVKKLILVRSGADRRASFTLMDSMEEFPACRKFARQNPEVVNAAAELEGQVKSFGVHAGGVLVADKPLWNYCSVRLDSKTGNSIANVDKHDIEDLGLLKIDVLGVDELTMIAHAVNLIEERHGIKIEPWEIPVDDYTLSIDPEAKAGFDRTMEQITLGNTVGVFQLHSKSLTRVCQNTAPDCFEDIAAIVALGRPGPMQSGAHYKYGKLKRGEIKSTQQWHPLISEICASTHGLLLYQEQLIRVVREIADFSWKMTGELRKTISKNIGIEYFFDSYLKPWQLGCWKNDKWLEGLKVMVPKQYEESLGNESKMRKLSDKIAMKQFQTYQSFGSWCGSGDTIISVKKNRKRLDISMKEAFDWYNSADYKRSEGISKILAKDGRVKRWVKFDRIVKSGIKKLYEMSLASGHKARFSKDHRFLLSDGSCKRLKDLLVGDKLIIEKEDLKCAICGKSAKNKKGLEVHLRRTHNLPKLKKYYHKYVPRPRCKCGCGKKVSFCKRKMDWNEYILGHHGIDNGVYYGNSYLYNSKVNGIVRLQSYTEVRAAVVMDEMGLDWERNKDWFRYKMDGRSRSYCPDIKVNYDGRIVYYEVKGAAWQADTKWNKLKFRSVRRDSELIVITSEVISCWEQMVGIDGKKYSSKIFKRILKTTDKIKSDYIRDWLITGSRHFGISEIKSIKYVGKEETYDVIGTETGNFIADGIVTKNSMNLCHAVAYGYISYVSMWLKTHYPIEFMTACIEVENNEAERRKLINEIKRLGISIFGPDVNKSGSKFRIEKDGIRCGLLDVKGVGIKAVETIIENAPYKSVFDFERKVNRRAVHKGVFAALIRAGALERFYKNTKLFLEHIDEILTDCKRQDGLPSREIRKEWRKKLNSDKDSFTDEELTRLKESVTTMIQGDSLITFYNGFLDSLGVPWQTVEDVGDFAESGKEVRDAVYVRAIVRSIDLKRYSQEVNYVVGGEEDFRYCLLDLDDETDFIMGSCEADVYARYEKLLWEWGVGVPILVKGNLASGRRKLYVSEMASLDELRFKFEGGGGYKALQHNEKSVLRTVRGNPIGISRVREQAKSILNGQVRCKDAWNKANLTAVGYISRAKVVQTKKDKKDMMFVSLEDDTGTIPIMVWPNDTVIDGGWIRKVFEIAENKGHAVKVSLRRMPGNEKFPETKFVVNYRGRPSVLPLTKKNIKALNGV